MTCHCRISLHGSRTKPYSSEGGVGVMTSRTAAFWESSSHTHTHARAHSFEFREECYLQTVFCTPWDASSQRSGAWVGVQFTSFKRISLYHRRPTPHTCTHPPIHELCPLNPHETSSPLLRQLIASVFLLACPTAPPPQCLNLKASAPDDSPHYTPGHISLSSACRRPRRVLRGQSTHAAYPQCTSPPSNRGSLASITDLPGCRRAALVDRRGHKGPVQMLTERTKMKSKENDPEYTNFTTSWGSEVPPFSKHDLQASLPLLTLIVL